MDARLLGDLAQALRSTRDATENFQSSSREAFRYERERIVVGETELLLPHDLECSWGETVKYVHYVITVSAVHATTWVHYMHPDP